MAWLQCNCAFLCDLGRRLRFVALGGHVILGQILVIVWGNGCVSSWKGGLDIAFVGFSYMFAELFAKLDIF